MRATVGHVRRRLTESMAIAVSAAPAISCAPGPRLAPTSSDAVSLTDTLRALVESGVEGDSLFAAVVLAGAGDEPSVARAVGPVEPLGRALSTDATCRITSLTKPVVAVGVLQLIEEGVLALEDDIAMLLPEFQRPGGAPTGSIRVLDVLRHTAELPPLSDPRVDSLFSHAVTSDELVRGLASLSSHDAPRRVFRYGPSYEVAGRLIEVASGQSLDRFLDDRAFAPLRMHSTGFVVPPEQRQRIPAVMRRDGNQWTTVVAAGVDPAEGNVLLSGGGGLRSTARDLYRFFRMLLNGGTLDGVRILGASLVDVMLTDQLGAMSPWRTDGSGWGLGVEVVGPPEGPARVFGWGGYFGGAAWASRDDGLLVVVLAHQHPEHRVALEGRIRRLVMSGARG